MRGSDSAREGERQIHMVNLSVNLFLSLMLDQLILVNPFCNWVSAPISVHVKLIHDLLICLADTAQYN
ncbi:unnamed protein product [Triticum turgidum subsp. durum]|uniref:Uncharacterized protein n=1 Tax=Triticum turgidum subsp. durum TaxID=4567 RepID=A0A9R1RV39_TRITD|nr:unnamed protein product [Triticum turgidum subsp. durum]